MSSAQLPSNEGRVNHTLHYLETVKLRVYHFPEVFSSHHSGTSLYGTEVIIFLSKF